MKTKKRKVGDIGEALAVKFLESKGFKVLEQNYLKKIGEIDIVAQKIEVIKNKKSQKNLLKSKIEKIFSQRKEKVYYFFEVKTASVDFENMEDLRFTPEDNFTNDKIHKFNRIVEYYVKDKNIEEDYFLGVLFVLFDPIKKKSKIRFMEKLEL